MNDFEVVGELRTLGGTRTARRLRRAGKVPAILYGGDVAPVALELNQKEVKKHLENEAFLSHILTVKVGEQVDQAVLRAIQRDPVSSDVTHMDLLRVSESKEIELNVPLHFINESSCPGVRVGGIVTHLVVEVEVRCLPRHLPEFIEVDVGRLEVGDTVHLSELRLPEGVELVALRHGEEEYDQALVSVQMPRAAEVEEEEAEAAEGELDQEITKLVESGGEAGEEDS